MTKEELEHDHIKKISENYVNESWGSFADLSGVDLVMAGIGVTKIISKEKERRITELEKACEETQKLLDKQIEATYRLDKENTELRAKESFVGDQNRKLCEQQQKIEVLEAENAELKELLKKWLQTSKASSCDNINIVTDTEQFLKESE